MPAALEVDHEQVKAVAIRVGVREAARQYGLTEAVVMKWSAEEGWMKHKQMAEDAIVTKQKNQGLSAVVSKSPSELLLQSGPKDKLLVATVARKAVKVIKRKSGDALVADMQPLKLATDVLKVAHGWGSESQSAQPLIAIQLNGYVPPESK